MVGKIYQKFNSVKEILAILMLSVYCIGVTISGGSILEVVLFVATCFGYVILPGLFFYEKLRIQSSFTDEYKYYSVAFVLGIAFFASLFCISSYLKFWWILRITPLIFTALYLYKIKSKSCAKNTNKNQNVLMLLIYSFAIFMYTFLCVAKHAHPAKVGEVILTQDFMWTVGNAQSLLNSFPPMDIRFSGVILKYHYLTELISAGFSSVSGISCYNILGFYMQIFIMAFFITAVKDFAYMYYNKNELKTNMFVISFFALSCLSLWKVFLTGTSVFGNSMLHAVLANTNSQCTGFAFMAVFSMLIVNFNKNPNQTISYWMVTITTFLLLIFSKSPMAAIIAIAMAFAVIFNFFTKNEKKKITLLSCLVIAIFSVVYFEFLSGGTSKSTAFSLTKTLELGYFKNYLTLFSLTNSTLYKVAIPVFIVLQTFCIAPFQFFTVVPKAIRDVFRIFKLSFEKLWFYRSIAGGVLAFFVTWHEAYSQVYFIYVAIFYFNLLAVEYFDFTKLKTKYIINYMFIALSCFTTLVFYINFGGSGLRQFGFHTDILQKPEYKFIMKSEDELAGEYLRENMQEGELFITNRTHTGAGEGLSNVYTCFSGKQSYMEGFKYTVSNMGTPWNVIEPRLENVGKIFGIYEQSLVSEEQVMKICKENNIRYAVYSSQFEGETDTLNEFETVFNDGTVKIYKMY